MTAKKRMTALLVALAMVFTMAFSVVFIVHESEHHCSGVDCHVCVLMNRCVKLLDNHTPKPEKAVFFAALVFAAVLCLGVLRGAAQLTSLISLKVKLSD